MLVFEWEMLVQQDPYTRRIVRSQLDQRYDDWSFFLISLLYAA